MINTSLIGGSTFQNANLSRAQTLKYPQQMGFPSSNQFMTQAQPTSQCGMCQKSFNLEMNMPKLLPCGHTFCLFCLTLQENQTQPTIQLSCLYCCITYSHVPASHFETNYEIVQVLEKLQHTLPLQQMQITPVSQLPYPQPQMMMGNQIYRSSPQKINGGKFGTPTRGANDLMMRTSNQGQNYDINQVAHIFENMKIEAIQGSPLSHKAFNKSPSQKYIGQVQASPINRSPNQMGGQFQQQQFPVLICSRKGCKNPRLRLMDGWITTNYCSKQCDDLDQNKGAFVRNQDDLYRQATRQGRSRSKSPIKLNNFGSDDAGFSPLRGNNNNRSRSPYQNKTAQNLMKNQSIFSSEESGFDSDTYRTPQINRVNNMGGGAQQPMQVNYNGESKDSMIRRLEYENASARKSNIQNTMGAFGDSAFERFVQSQQKETPSNYNTPSTQAFTQYANNTVPFSFSNRQPEPIHQQYYQRRDSTIQDSKLDIMLAPNDPMKCVNPRCRNRKFLLNGNYLPVCSRKCALSVNIAFTN